MKNFVQGEIVHISSENCSNINILDIGAGRLPQDKINEIVIMSFERVLNRKLSEREKKIIEECTVSLPLESDEKITFDIYMEKLALLDDEGAKNLVTELTKE